MNLLFWRKKRESRQDPLAAFDAAVERLEQRAAKVRQAAALLLSVQGELAMRIEATRRRSDELGKRVTAATRDGDAASKQVLEADREHANSERAAFEADLKRTRSDAEQLKAAARELGAEIEALRGEQSLARTRLAAGEAITTAFHSRSDAFDSALGLDDARSELERAHALAEIYRKGVP